MLDVIEVIDVDRTMVDVYPRLGRVHYRRSDGLRYTVSLSMLPEAEPGQRYTVEIENEKVTRVHERAI